MQISITKDSKPEKIISDLYKLPKLKVGRWQAGDVKAEEKTLLCVEREYIIADKKDGKFLGTKHLADCLVFYAVSEEYRCIVHCEGDGFLDWVKFLSIFSGQKQVQFTIAGGMENYSRTQKILRWIVTGLIDAVKQLGINMSSTHQFITDRNIVSKAEKRAYFVDNIILLGAKRLFFCLFKENIDMNKIHRFIAENVEEILAPEVKVLGKGFKEENKILYFGALIINVFRQMDEKNYKIYEDVRNRSGIENESIFYDLLYKYLINEYKHPTLTNIFKGCVQAVNITNFIFSPEGDELIPISVLAATSREAQRIMAGVEVDYYPFYKFKEYSYPKLSERLYQSCQSILKKSSYPGLLTQAEYKMFYPESELYVYYFAHFILELSYNEFPIIEKQTSNTQAHLEKKLTAPPDLLSVFNASGDPGKALRRAAALGKLLHLERLVKDYPGYVNSKSSDLSTPLHLAIANGHRECAELLLSHNADRTAFNNKSQTPIQCASSENTAYFKELFEKFPISASASCTS